MTSEARNEGFETSDEAFWNAVAQAEAELSEGNDSDEPAPTQEPAQEDVLIDDQAEPEVEAEAVEQPADESPEVDTESETEDVFADLDEDEQEEAPQGISIPDWDTPALTLPGIDQPVSLREVAEGYLRQSDYTRKTQELASQRKSFETEQEVAVTLWKNLQDAPAETVAWLAVQAGLVDESEVGQRLRGIDGLRFPSEDDIEAEVNKRLEQRLTQHPTVQQAARDRQLQAINTEFAQVEAELGRELTDNDKRRVLQYAANNGIPSVVVAFNALWAERQRQQQRKKSAARATTERPKGHAQTRTVFEEVPKDVDEAFERALAILGS